MSPHSRLHVRPLAIVLLGALITFGGLAPQVHAENQAAPLTDIEAVRDLATLTRYLKDKKSNTSQIVQYVHLVSRAYVDFKAPDAGAAALEPAGLKQFEMNRAAFRQQAERQLFRALRLQRVRNEQNVRDMVNVRAAQAIGHLAKAYPGEAGKKARSRLSQLMRKAIERLKDVRYELNLDVLEAEFAALAEFGTLDTLEWLLKEFTHTKEREEDWLLAAHRAMVRFPVETAVAEKSGRTFVPGRLRMAVVDKFITAYTAVETAANTSRNDAGIVAKKRFWDHIKNATIRVLQHFARQPKNPETGVALASMTEFRDWFRHHDKSRQAPWIEPE